MMDYYKPKVNIGMINKGKQEKCEGQSAKIINTINNVIKNDFKHIFLSSVKNMSLVLLSLFF